MMSRLLSKHLAWHRRQCDEAEEEEPVDRRLARRYLLPGSKVRIVVDGLAFDLHLKDLSWRGLCGLTDAPLARGQAVVILFAGGYQMEAEIRWARTVVVGAVFRDVLPDETMRTLWRRYRSRRRKIAAQALAEVKAEARKAEANRRSRFR
jgi:hypothetical protein